VRRTRLIGCEVTVPGDASAAAFFLCAAAAEPGARVTAAGMTLNPTRTGLLGVLESMGATVERANERTIAGEPVGDVTVTGPSGLRAVEIAPALVPTLVDELPAWAVAASAAHGVSRVTGAGELRVKESDRVAAVVRNLGALGLAAREFPDGFEVEGGRPRGGRVEAGLDHRIVMAFAALGARCAEPVTFDDVSSVATSYPAFWDDLASLGAAVEFAAA
jgi:3-phosphoshikimate 1-carboxyvinyltransferase